MSRFMLTNILHRRLQIAGPRQSQHLPGAAVDLLVDLSEHRWTGLIALGLLVDLLEHRWTELIWVGVAVMIWLHRNIRQQISIDGNFLRYFMILLDYQY